MTQNDSFLQEFQANLGRLIQINTIVDKNIEDKKNFTNSIVTKLGEINQTIKTLGNKINVLKTSADQLQAQVNANSNDIGQKQSQMDALLSQVQSLTEEKNNLN